MNEHPTNEFLNLLYTAIPYGFLELTLLRANSYAKVHWLELPNQLNQEQVDYLHAMNEDGWNVYFGVTVRSGKSIRGRGHVGDALFTRVLWADMDTKTDAALARLQAARPSLIIDSGGGYHGYWLLNEALVLSEASVPNSPRGRFASVDSDLLKRTLKELALYLEADTKVAEFARIMRLPGFKNMKPERGAALCQVIEEKLYTYDFNDLATEYAWLVKEPLKAQRPMMSAPASDLPAWIKRYLESGAAAGERNDTFNKVCYAYNALGKTRHDAEMDLAPRARADGLDEHEVQATLSSAFRSVATPYVNDNRVAARDRGMVNK